MTSITITGLPGTGKTHLAMSLGNALMSRGQSTLILHTDILKVTLRQFFPELKGAGYKGDFATKLGLIYPYLQEQIVKANKDNYCLIIEGTLALGLSSADLPVILQLPLSHCQERWRNKHYSAQKSLFNTSLEKYNQALESSINPSTLCLDGSEPILDLVAKIIEQWERIK